MDWQEIAGTFQFASTLGMLGVIWVVQLCVYPRFEDLDPQKFIGAHQRHCRGIGLVVGPLMMTELVTAVFLVWVANDSWLQWAILFLTLAIFLTTAIVQAPCHDKLSQGFDQRRCQSLTQGNWLRTGLWSIKAILVMTLELAIF